MAHQKTNKVFLIIAVVLALAAVVSGFLLIGSPAHQRKVASDNRRLQDLQQIASAIYNRAYGYGKIPMPYPAQQPITSSTIALPATLDELTKNNSSGYDYSNLPVIDQTTKLPYDYRVIDRSHYELCARFETDNANELQNSSGYSGPVVRPATLGMGASPASFWHHPIGRACFTFSVVEYPPYVPIPTY
jgi:type II secretory pathway pseudopilin PulG